MTPEPAQTLPHPLWCSHPIYSLSVHCSRGAGVTGMLALLPDGEAAGAGATSLLLLGRSCGHTASPGSSSAAAGGHSGGYRGLAARTRGGGWCLGPVLGTPLPAAGNKGAAWRPCRGPTRGQVSLLCTWGRGGVGPRAGRETLVSPVCPPRVPGDSRSLVLSVHLLWHVPPRAAADGPASPGPGRPVAPGAPWGSRPRRASPNPGHRPSLVPPPRGQRGNAPGSAGTVTRGRAPPPVPGP